MFFITSYTACFEFIWTGAPRQGYCISAHNVLFYSTQVVYKSLYNDSTLLCGLQHTKCVERLFTCTLHGPPTITWLLLSVSWLSDGR